MSPAGETACGRDRRNPEASIDWTGFQPWYPVAPAMAGIRKDGGWVSPDRRFSSSLVQFTGLIWRDGYDQETRLRPDGYGFSRRARICPNRARSSTGTSTRSSQRCAGNSSGSGKADREEEKAKPSAKKPVKKPTKKPKPPKAPADAQPPADDSQD
jgi:hypothetical protein